MAKSHRNNKQQLNESNKRTYCNLHNAVPAATFDDVTNVNTVTQVRGRDTGLHKYRVLEMFAYYLTAHDIRAQTDEGCW